MVGASDEVIDKLLELNGTLMILENYLDKTINGKDWAEAKLIKENVKKDVL